MRAVEMDIGKSGNRIFTYTKLGRFIVLGFVYEPNTNHWQGTKVNSNKGIVAPKKYMLPQDFWDYLNHRARRMADLLNSVSDKQQSKIRESFHKDLDHYLESDSYQAMLADVAMFGNDAFSKRNNRRSH
jgi:hypothetical protein